MPTGRDTRFDTLIPELPHWNGGDGISIDDWIGAIGRHDHAIGFSRVFWPEFVLHDGFQLRAGFDRESFEGFRQRCGGSKKRVEGVMNHEHVRDMLMGMFNAGERPSREQVLYLGRVLREMWSAKLKLDFPGLDIVVSFTEGDPDDLDTCEISVYQAGEGGS